MKRAVLGRRQQDAVDDAHGLGQRRPPGSSARVGRRDLVASRQAAQGPPGVGAKQPYDLVQLDDQPVGIGLARGGEAHLAVEIEHDPGAGSVLAEAQAGGFGPGRSLTAEQQSRRATGSAARTTATAAATARSQAVRSGSSTLGCRRRFISLGEITRLWMHGTATIVTTVMVRAWRESFAFNGLIARSRIGACQWSSQSTGSGRRAVAAAKAGPRWTRVAWHGWPVVPRSFVPRSAARRSVAAHRNGRRRPPPTRAATAGCCCCGWQGGYRRFPSMVKRMLIDATHPEETRAVVLDDRYLVDFDFETSTKLQLKGNIYLAKITRVEPSLQAAFVEYGGNRHGFLAFSEIHPDYYQVPQADRALLEDIEREAATKPGACRPRGRGRRRRAAGRDHHHRRGRGNRRGDGRSGAPSRATAAQLQDPGGDQAPADHAGAGRQGGARQQGRGAHHLPVAGRPLLRADAQHAARRRHQPQDRPGRRPPQAEGDRARARGPDTAWG